MKKTLTGLNFKVAEAEGGYFIWTRLPENHSDGYTFSLQLYQSQKVGVVPGENFSPSKKQFIRINIATDFSLIKQGAESIRRFIS